MVNNDGRNRYPNDANWLTDGYGDYIRHFLGAMAAVPELAPSDEGHILCSTSVIQERCMLRFPINGIWIGLGKLI